MNLLADKKWEDISELDRKLILGSCAILSDWQESVTSGVFANIKGLEPEGLFVVD